MAAPSQHRVSVTVDSTFWDTFRASLILIRYQGALIIVHSIFPLAGLAVLALGFVTRFRQGATQAIATAVLAFLFTPLVTGVTAFFARRNALMQGPFTYAFDSAGVHTKSAAFEQTISWAAIVKVRQSNSFLFIFISPIKALFIPVKALRDQGVIDEVRDITRQHIRDGVN